MNFIEPLKWFLVAILTVLGGYVVVRVLTKAIFRSFFEEVDVFSQRRSISKLLEISLKSKLKEKEHDRS